MKRDLIAIRYLPEDYLETLLHLTHDFRNRYTNRIELPSLERTNLGLLFSSVSRRTKSSFHQAANLIGCNVVEYSPNMDWKIRGESLKDAVKTISQELIDILVVRHHSGGAPGYASKYFNGPIINAGDGNHEHPTQAIADAATIYDYFGKIRGLTVTMIGDFSESRVARSSAWMLSKLGAEVRWVGPKNLMPIDYSKLPVTVYAHLDDALKDTDVVYCLRMKNKRIDDRSWGSLPGFIKAFQLNSKRMKLAQDGAIILHAGPVNRGLEIEDVLVDSENFLMGKQIEYGLFARSASIYWSTQKAVEDDVLLKVANSN